MPKSMYAKKFRGAKFPEKMPYKIHNEVRRMANIDAALAEWFLDYANPLNIADADEFGFGEARLFRDPKLRGKSPKLAAKFKKALFAGDNKYLKKYLPNTYNAIQKGDFALTSVDITWLNKKFPEFNFAKATSDIKDALEDWIDDPVNAYALRFYVMPLDEKEKPAVRDLQSRLNKTGLRVSSINPFPWRKVINYANESE
mgnify:CR=1 FL=1